MHISWKTLIVASLAIRQITGSTRHPEAAACSEDEETCMLQHQLKKQQSEDAKPRKSKQARTLTVGQDFKYNDKIQWSDASAPDRAQDHGNASAGCQAGGRLWVGQTGVDLLMESVFPVLISSAHEIAIAPISGQASLWDTELLTWNYSLSNFAVENITFPAAQPAVRFEEGVGLLINLTGLEMTMSVQYDFQPASGSSSWFGSTGSISMSTHPATSIIGHLQLNGNSLGKPALASEVTNFDLQLDSINIDSGSWMDGIMEFAANLMRRVLVSYVNPHIPALIEEFVNVTINNQIADVDMSLPLTFLEPPFNEFAVDFGLCNVDFTNRFVSADLHANIVSTTHDITYSVASPALPLTPDHEPQMLEVEFLAWGFNSGLYLAHELNMLTFHFPNLTPATRRHAEMLTRTLHPGRAFPGSNLFVITLETQTAPEIAFSEDGIDLTGTFQVKLNLSWGEGSGFEVVALQVPAHARVNVQVHGEDEQNASLVLTHFEADTTNIIIANAIIMDAGILVDFVNLIGDDLLIPAANRYLQDYLLELGPWSGVHLHHALFASNSDHLTIGSDFSINVDELFNTGIFRSLLKHSSRRVVRSMAQISRH